MSPDERVVADAIAGAVRRSRAMAALETSAWGMVAAAVSLPAAVVVALLVTLWRLPGTARRQVVRTLDRTSRTRNLLVTADELVSGRLTAAPHVRDRVFAHAATAARQVDRGCVYPAARLRRPLAAGAIVWILVWTTTVWRVPLGRLISRSSDAARAPAAVLRVNIAVKPPSYTGVGGKALTDPSEIAVVDGSILDVTIEVAASRVTSDFGGEKRVLIRDVDGRFVDRVEVTKTTYYMIDTDAGGRRLMPVVAVPDALPSVKINAPGRDLAFADPHGRIAFETRAEDDFGLRSLSLQFTKVSGSGENFEFREGEIPLTVTRLSARDWRGAASSSLADLGLNDGDLLVYRASASDRRPGNGSATSDAYFIEISKLGVAAGDAFTIPEQETRYALSQQMLVVKTERLDRARAAMKPADVTDAAVNLAVEQRMIRAEFVFMLGGEIENEEVEAEQSTELQEGRLQNRGQRDLRAATVAMSQAEQLLAGAHTHEALTAERAAIVALQRAFARDRYILRALASQTRLDPNRRLTGSLGQAGGWRRDRSARTEGRRAALVRDLLAGVAALRSQPRNELAVELAREALLVDAESAALRRIAAELQRIAASWSTTAAGQRLEAIDAVAAAVAAEAAQALASPPLEAPFVSSSLAGAFVDALQGKSSR